MYKKIIAMLLILCLVLGAAPIYVGAAGGGGITASDMTVTAGDHFTMYIRAEDFLSVASLDLYIYYDAEALSVSSASSGSVLSGTQYSVNTSAAGTVKLSAISLNGINGSGTLLSISFQANGNAKAGTYPVRIAVGDAFDTMLSPIAIKSTDASVTVNERVQTEEFSIYGYPENYISTYSKGDILNYKICSSYSSRSFTGADFIVEYDHEIFELVSVELSSALKSSDAIYSVNTNTLGLIRISYAAVTAVSAYDLLSVSLRVIADKDLSTTLTAKAQNVYREDLSAYVPTSTSYSIQITKLPEVIDLPDLYLETDNFIAGDSASSTLYLEKGAGVAAGDFSISYDPQVLRCIGVTADGGIGNLGGMIVINDNFSEGRIRFSYINMEAYDDTDVPLINITWEPICSPDEHYKLETSGVGVVDAQQKAVELEYVTDSDCIYGRTVIPPTCTVEGRTDYTCACSDSYSEDFVPALGHDEVFHEAREVSCTDVGWNDYITCNRCDYTTYEEIAPLGHRVLVGTRVIVDSVAVENDANYPFHFADGVYSSVNKADGSAADFIITALYDCTVDFTYGASSESGWDKLSILKNGTNVVEASGSLYWYSLSLDLSAGDVVTVRYSKDGSVSSGDDTGYFSFTCPQTEIDDRVPTPAEDVEPTCTEAVECDFCGFVLKEALGHTGVIYEGKEPTCYEMGWNEYVICDRCGYNGYEEIGPLGHDEIRHEAKEPGCFDVGWSEYVTCSRCDYTTYTELEPLGHRVLISDYVWVDSVETENDATYPFELSDGVYSSTNKDHNSDSYFTITALYDCTLEISYKVSSEGGYDKLIVYKNGASLATISGEIDWESKTVELNAGDTVSINYHKDVSASVGQDTGYFSFSCNKTQTGTFETGPAENAFPTCTEAVICYYCSAVVKEALGHDEVLNEGKEPTCTEGGWNEYVTCKRCDYSGYEEIAPLGHDEIDHEAKAPGCTEIGWYEYVTCSRCDYTTYTELEPLGHRVLISGKEWVDPVAFENDESYPFLYENGVYSSTNKDNSTDSYFTFTALYDCLLEISYKVSSEARYDKLFIIKNGKNLIEVSGEYDWDSLALELGAGDTVVVNYHKDGSTATGSDTAWFSFECDQAEVESFVPAPAEDAEPTCTEAVVCHFCSEVVKEALGHDGVTYEGKEPTCTEGGWSEYIICQRCGYSGYEEIPALGHDEITHESKDATCTEIGWNEYVTCSRCDYTTYEEIPALGHDEITHESKDATCTEIGWNEYVTCSRCDYTTYEEIAALGHDEIAHESKNATCTEIGWNEYVTCSRCDYTTYEEIAALGHDEITHDSKEATCTEIGWNSYVTCSRCDYTTYEEIVALGHDEITHDSKDATCTEIGWNEYVTCSRCDYTTYEEIAAKGHSFENGSCTACGEAQPGEPDGYTLGDINGDGAINGKDSNLIKQIIAGAAMPSDTEALASDVNRDGNINGVDANLIAQFLAGNIGGF